MLKHLGFSTEEIEEIYGHYINRL